MANTVHRSFNSIRLSADPIEAAIDSVFECRVIAALLTGPMQKSVSVADVGRQIEAQLAELQSLLENHPARPDPKDPDHA